jgi:ribose transport system substrate-binding protein
LYRNRRNRYRPKAEQPGQRAAVDWEDLMKRLGGLKRCAVLASATFGLMATLAVRPGLAADEVKAPSAAEQQKAMALVPAGARASYDHYWTFSPIFANPYANWTPPKTPWKFCYSDSALGLSWRADLLKELKKMVAQYAAAGLTQKDVPVTDSNNNIGVQLTQFSNLVRQGCQIIIAVPGTPTGLCGAMKDARQKGVLVVTVQSAVECDEAINVGSNQYTGAARMTEWVVKEMGGKGNIMFVLGVPGISTTVSTLAGAKAPLAKYPNVHLLDSLYGFWAPAPAKTKLVQWLATHSQPIDGVVSAGGMATAIDEALLQSGRKLVPQANGTNECSYIAYWHDNKLHSFALSAGGGSNGYEAFQVAMRMLFGQKPSVNTIWFDLPGIEDAEMAKLYQPGMTPQNTSWCDPPDHRLVADNYFDQFFTGGKPISPAPNP